MMLLQKFYAYLVRSEHCSKREGKLSPVIIHQQKLGFRVLDQLQMASSTRK